MAKPSKKTPEQKLQIVLTVLRGEVTAMEAALLTTARRAWPVTQNAR